MTTDALASPQTRSDEAEEAAGRRPGVREVRNRSAVSR